jgi:membrane protease YdiL (CAAX protease family)
MRRNTSKQIDLRRIDMKWLLVAPGLTLMLLGLALAEIFHIPMPASISVEILVPATVTAFLIATTLASLFEQHSSSFKQAGGMLESIISRLGLTPTWALALGLTSGIGEEVFFRGLLLHAGLKFFPAWLAVIAQALAFAAMHPAPRRAWAYPLWTFLIGLAFGIITLEAHSLVPVMLAHYVFNHGQFNGLLKRPVAVGGD